MTWRVVLSKQAVKDAKKIKQAGLKDKCASLLALLETDPFQTPPRYEKLVGNLSGFYSRRINIQHRLVCQVIEEKRAIHVLRMWSHYGE